VFVEVIPIDLDDGDDFSPVPFPSEGDAKFVIPGSSTLEFEYTRVNPADFSRIKYFNATREMTVENFVQKAQDLRAKLPWEGFTKFIFLGVS
jgi:hypothetical protein